MKLLAAMVLTGLMAGGSAMATDYSVGIVKLGTGAEGGGTALNLYAIKKSGIHLVQTYVLQQDDYTGNLASPLTLAMNPAHDFVYVVYTGLTIPNIVGFSITPTGMVYEWENEIQTGDGGLQGSTLTGGPGYVIENTYPAGLWVHVVNQTGAEVINDYADGGSAGIYLISGQVDSSMTFYYSCRSTASTPPAKSVSVFSFEDGVDVYTSTATPVATSTDPVFVRSVCR
ncbi:MAG: hypothetical protein ABSH33_21650 [Steroidobacteraceae bacterium]|jgi:hypothetical protein